jgi:signal peptidase I
MTPMTTLLPLNVAHLKTLQKALFTSRFYIRSEHAFRYHEENQRPQRAIFDPLFPQVPDGCYEFEAGVGYKIGWGAIRSKLPDNHPLYSSNAANIQKLFNLGINFNLLFQPVNSWQPFVPERFAYYRNGDLYLMGQPLLSKEDPHLMDFVEKERKKESNSTDQAPYVAFVDHGPPQTAEFIEAFGLKIPETGVLALGDNYSMSADSRDFGFVPVHNLRGAPLFTFWPPSSRVGPLPQTFYPYLKLPNILLLIGLGIVAFGTYSYYKKRKNTFK